MPQGNVAPVRRGTTTTRRCDEWCMYAVGSPSLGEGRGLMTKHTRSGLNSQFHYSYEPKMILGLLASNWCYRTCKCDKEWPKNLSLVELKESTSGNLPEPPDSFQGLSTNLGHLNKPFPLKFSPDRAHHRLPAGFSYIWLSGDCCHEFLNFLS